MSSPHVRPSDGRRRLPDWIAFVAGFLVMPLVMASYAEAITRWYDVPDGRRHATAMRVTQDLTEALDRYSNRRQRLPNANEGLAALEPDFIGHLPLDPWGHPFVYAPSTGTLWADVISYGADGQPGGTGWAADISGRFGRLDDPPSAAFDAVGRIGLCVIPIATLLATRRWRRGGFVLAGMATFWAALLLTSLNLSFESPGSAFLALAVALVCLAGSVATFKNARGAPALTCLAVVVTSLLLEHIISL